MPIVAFSQSADQNYIITTKYKVPAQFTEDVMSGLEVPPTVSNNDKTVSITYFDGLGRPIQQIGHRQSNTGNDIITHIEHDAVGRQVKDFLPYVNQSPSLNYVSGAGSGVGGFYNTQVFDYTLNPFSQKDFEPSPLNRVMKQAAPGNAWAMGTGKEIKFEYNTNGSNEIKLFTAIATWNASTGLYEISLSQNGDYPEGTLYKTITKDENWTVVAGSYNNTTEEYKDKNGKVILKRTYNMGDAHDTYYIYDQYGNLTYVLPPLVNTTNAITTTVLDGLCYQYKYDKNNRLAEKKLPGKQWEFIVYDKLDRVVATGPHNAPFSDDPNIGWLITKYDVFGRVAYTGWYSGHYPYAPNRKVLQDLQNNATTINEERSAPNTINNFSVAYTNNVFPTGGFYLLSVNYYDNYNYPGAPTVPSIIEGQNVLQNVKSLPTGNWARVLDNNYAGNLNTVFYDEKHRTISSRTTHYTGGYTETDSQLDYSGKTLMTKTRHKRVSGDTEIKIQEDFVYSNQDRLITHMHKINNDPAQLIAKNTYDDLGQLMSKDVGGTNIAGPGLQKIDYTYNVRGWLKGINDVNDLNVNPGENDLFAYKINYNDNSQSSSNPLEIVPQLFNGNISETFWRTASDNVLRKYGYVYDHMNRLTSATYQKPQSSVTVTNSYNESADYDKNGNILNLQRTGEYDDSVYSLVIDNLSYTYHNDNKNQLMKVFDSSNITKGFLDDSNGISDPNDDYTYDLNGNMTSDANKSITSIIYNHLNQPLEINFVTGKKIVYVYDATGQKVKKIADEFVGGVTGYQTKEIDYLNGFQYKDSYLLFFPHAEGYVNVIASAGNIGNIYSYAFNYTDHLGNIRLSYGFDTATGSLKILEESNYYPFGLKHMNYNISQKTYIKNGMGSIINSCPTCPQEYRYKYNSKEWQEELGLNMYDYGARNFDPALGRWMNIDPLAENSRRWTPYNYAYNNPMYFVDPDGMQSERFDGVEYGGGHWSDSIRKKNQSDGEAGNGDGDPPKKKKKNWLARLREKTKQWADENIRKPIDEDLEPYREQIAASREANREILHNQLGPLYELQSYVGGGNASSLLIGRSLNYALRLESSVLKVMGETYEAVAEVSVPIKNKNLLNKLKNTSRGEWVKVYEAGLQNGEKIETHYFRNNRTGQVFDVKVKYDYWHQKVFKKLRQ